MAMRASVGGTTWLDLQAKDDGRFPSFITLGKVLVFNFFNLIQEVIVRVKFG